eukprot:scaffold8676_cov22-Tisochrysis_lutea.AAC.1
MACWRWEGASMRMRGTAVLRAPLSNYQRQLKEGSSIHVLSTPSCCMGLSGSFAPISAGRRVFPKLHQTSRIPGLAAWSDQHYRMTV